MPRKTALVLLLLLAAGPALSQTASFAALDSDGSGAISRDEFLALRRAMFARIDADASGSLTAAEIEAARTAMPQSSRLPASTAVWSQDANGDGLLTVQEYTAESPGFDRADRNGDGQLSVSEFDRLRRLLATYAG